jgi:uncharacterized protein YecE (DUF72 family)
METQSQQNGGRVRFGTSSFSTRDWIGSFYPQGTKPEEFLKVYAQHFDTVEIDSTYYAIPALKTVEGWAERVPSGFTIAAKFPRSIVHGGTDAKPNPDTILTPAGTYDLRDKFLTVMSRLGVSLGPLVLQFPYFSKEIFSHSGEFLTRLDHFLSGLPKEYSYGVEIRNKYWLNQEFAEVCRAHGAAVVLTDYMWMPLGDEAELLFDPLTTDFCYVRLIGNRKEIEKVTKTWEKEVIDREDRLNRWASFLDRIARRGGNIFVYINNHYAGHAPATVRRLRQKYMDLQNRGSYNK